MFTVLHLFSSIHTLWLLLQNGKYCLTSSMFSSTALSPWVVPGTLALNMPFFPGGVQLTLAHCVFNFNPHTSISTSLSFLSGHFQSSSLLKIFHFLKHFVPFTWSLVGDVCVYLLISLSHYYPTPELFSSCNCGLSLLSLVHKSWSC